MNGECCPLCKSKVGKLKVMFVEYVTSSEKTMKKYFDKTLTFEMWLNEMEKAIEEAKNEH